MSLMGSKVMKHQWTEMKVTPVDVVIIDGEVHILSSGKESQVTVGCFRCNMGLSEGVEVECPGHDLFAEGDL